MSFLVEGYEVIDTETNEIQNSESNYNPILDSVDIKRKDRVDS